MFRKTIVAVMASVLLGLSSVKAQVNTESRDTIISPTPDSLFHAPQVVIDSTLRIVNLNPFFTIHVDSMLTYQLAINRDESQYYWYLKNSPVGLKINKDNGTLTFKAEKSFFLSGKLKYDQ